VEVAVALVVGLLVFFFRATMGACSASSAASLWSSSFAAFISSAICFARSCLSFFAWFLPFLIGAVPTLPLGGGEFARDKEVEATEAMSDIRSLAGVPGRLIDVMLGCLDGILAATAAGKGGGTLEDEDTGGGVSALGVANTRMVLGCVGRFKGEPVEVAAGVPGLEVVDGVCAEARIFAGVSTLAEVVVVEAD